MSGFDSGLLGFVMGAIATGLLIVLITSMSDVQEANDRNAVSDYQNACDMKGGVLVGDACIKKEALIPML